MVGRQCEWRLKLEISIFCVHMMHKRHTRHTCLGRNDRPIAQSQSDRRCIRAGPSPRATADGPVPRSRMARRPPDHLDVGRGCRRRNGDRPPADGFAAALSGFGDGAATAVVDVVLPCAGPVKTSTGGMPAANPEVRIPARGGLDRGHTRRAPGFFFPSAGAFGASPPSSPSLARRWRRLCSQTSSRRSGGIVAIGTNESTVPGESVSQPDGSVAKPCSNS